MWLRLSGFAGAVALLHVLGWGLFAWYASGNPALAGLGVLAYTFGLRHAFDADHIAAIDNTTRTFLARGKRSLGVGFFFSLGHSTVVFGLCTGLAVAATTVKAKIPGFQTVGGYVGTGVSGSSCSSTSRGSSSTCAAASSTRRGSRRGCTTAG
jgi:nickel/cobalt transporter (NiCoT) family protein